MRIGLVALISCMPTLALAASSVQASLTRFSREPSITEVQKAALEHFAVDPEALASLRSRAASKAVLPVLEVSGGLANADLSDDVINQEFSPNQVWVDRDASGTARDVRAKLTWSLPELVFNPEVLGVIGLSSRSEAVVKEVTNLFFARRRLQVEAAVRPPVDEEAVLMHQLRVEELTSLIDGLTGGWYRKALMGGAS